MAMIGNPYAKYQDSKILTATPAELTLMLYEGIIKFTNIAIAAVENYEENSELIAFCLEESCASAVSIAANLSYHLSS